MRILGALEGCVEIGRDVVGQWHFRRQRGARERADRFVDQRDHAEFTAIDRGASRFELREVELFDEVVVAAMRNPQKGDGVFDLDEREQMIKESVAHLPSVSVTRFSTLVVDLARELDVQFIIKGLRAVSDFENELQMAQMNDAVSGVRTVFIPSASSRSFLASKLIREIARFGGDVSSMVPEPVQRRIIERYSA